MIGDPEVKNAEPQEQKECSAGTGSECNTQEPLDDLTLTGDPEVSDAMNDVEGHAEDQQEDVAAFVSECTSGNPEATASTANVYGTPRYGKYIFNSSRLTGNSQ